MTSSLNPAWIHQQIVDHSPFGIILVDAGQEDLPIVYVNSGFERLTGYSASEVLGRNSRFLQGVDRNQEGLSIIRQALQQEQACVTVLRNYRKDGSLFWNELSITPLRDSHGVVIHYMGTLNNITARKETELALVQSHQSYRQVFDNNRAIKLLIDPATGEIKDTNRTAVEFYGYSREQLLSMTINQINVLSEDAIQKEMQKAASQDRISFEFRHRLSSGEIRNVNVFSSAVDLPTGRFLYSIIVDVTDKHQAEQRYRTLFQQTSDAVLISDLSGHYLEVNQRAADMVGYTCEDITTLTYLDLVVPEYVPKSAIRLRQLLIDKQASGIETVIRHKNGGHIFVEITSEVICDDEGLPLYIQSIARDITQRKQMEEQLRQSEAKFRMFVEQSTDGVTLTDEAGIVIEWNHSMGRLTGLAQAEALGQTLWDLQYQMALPHNQTSEAYEGLKAFMQQTLHTGQTPWKLGSVETQVKLKDGTLRTIQQEAFSIQTHEGYRLGSIVRDVTEQRQTEEKLRQSEEQLRLVTENAADLICTLDADLHFVYASASYKTILGYASKDLVGQSAFMWVHPEDAEWLEPQGFKIVAEHLTIGQAQFRLRRSDGVYLWVEAQANLLYNTDGTLKNWVVVLRDVTDRHQLQQLEMEQARLQVALHKEQELSALKTVMMIRIAHEFRTPLTIIVSAVETFWVYYERLSVEQRETKKHIIDGQIKHITRMLDDISLVVTGSFRPHSLMVGMVDLNDLLQQVIKELETESQQNIQFQLHIENSPLLRGDWASLYRAIYEILSNAARFSPGHRPVVITSKQQTETLEIQIVDQGIGIQPKEIPRIFQPFFRGSNINEASGLGLGLTIANGIIEEHQGSLTIKSQVGMGTQVQVVLPLRI